MNAFIRRIAETFLLSAVCSAPFAAVFYFGILPKARYWYLLMFGLSLFFFLFVNWIFCRNYYLSCPSGKQFYKVNLSVYGIYILISFVVLYFRLAIPYTFLFMPPRFLEVFGVRALHSFVIVHLVMLITISIIPPNYVGAKKGPLL